ncbi:porin family protein [Endozoicomonas sp. SM1973]|uniref:Porin family protein n=1 Tax=Spartinivicinus marinus TaxID=2994442 RepID=A0A853IA23_9GAMM|nr:outer membrane beta-barrel protein [Spartinivicinus marinus]MCX4027247.1 outer membrane beta-barrel protein [Spartinivicinus marinus]NYZ69759.1 porin family protein [Spartinivicinus marinus]
MKRAVLAVAVVSTFAIPSFAENNLNPFEDEKSGFYLGLGLGAADYDKSYDEWKDGNFGYTKYQVRDGAANIFAGYRVNKYFALEVNYAYLGNPDAKNTHLDHAYEVENKIRGYGIKAVGIYPINNSFELKASAGVMKWKVEEDYSTPGLGNGQYDESSSERGSSLTVGFGANYNLTENVAFGLQWERINDVGDKELRFGETDIDVYSASVQYKF